MVTKLMCKIRKVVEVVWPEYVKTCHFEHFAAIFNSFPLFKVKQKKIIKQQTPSYNSTYGYQASCAKSEKLLK